MGIDDEDICWSCPQLPTTSVVDLEATTSVIPSVTSGSASFFADAPEAPKQYTAAGKEEHSVTSRDKIAFRQFRIGDLALFIRVSPPSEDSSKNAIFLAFNEEQPHYYLSEESARLAGGSAAYLVGRLVFVDRCVASEGLNPFGL